MILILDAMLAVSGLVLLFAAPWVKKWIEDTISTPILRKALQVLGALIVLVPIVALVVSQVQQRTASLSPEVAQQIGVGAAMAWAGACLIIPLVILSCGEWDVANKEVFKLVVGFCLCVNVSLLVWALVNETLRTIQQREAVVMVGPLRWAAPVGAFALAACNYLMLRLRERFPPFETPEQNTTAASPPPQQAQLPPVLPPPPAEPKKRGRSAKPKGAKD